MNPELILAGLEELAAEMGLKVRYENFSEGEVEVHSGRCRLKGENMLIIDRRLKTAGRIEVLLAELKRLDLTDVYMKPYLRALLEGEVPGKT